jgi:hypothetical protein
MTIDVISAARARTRRRLLIAVLIPVGIAALIYPAGLWANTRLDADPAPPAATATAAPTPIASTVDSSVLPTGVTWVRVAGVDLPVSPVTGPTQVDAGLARGFAHARAGAVVAALHLLVRTTAQVGPAVFDPTITAQVVGPDQAAMRAQVAADYAQAATAAGIGYGQPLGDLRARFAAVSIDAYADAACDLTVLTTTADATGTARYAATTVHMRWTGTDWALEAPPGGRWDSQVHLVDPAQTSGYLPLPGR